MVRKAKHTSHPVDATTGTGSTGIKMPAPKTPEGTPMVPPAEGLPPQPGLSVGDLKKMVQIVQICTQRGAFKAEELKTVGETYTNLVNFLVSTGAIPKGDAVDKPAEGDEAPAVETNETAPATEDSASTESN